MYYLFPSCIVDDMILWEIIGENGDAVVGQMIKNTEDPTPVFNRLTNKVFIKCAADDDRVINAQRKAFE